MNLNVSPGLNNSITKLTNDERIKIAHDKWHHTAGGMTKCFAVYFFYNSIILAAIDDPNHTQKLVIPYRFPWTAFSLFVPDYLYLYFSENITLRAPSSPQNQKLSYIRSIDLSVSYSHLFALVQRLCAWVLFYKVRVSCGIWFFNLGRYEWNKFCLVRWFCCVLSTEVIAWILFFIRYFPLHLLRTRI